MYFSYHHDMERFQIDCHGRFIRLSSAESLFYWPLYVSFTRSHPHHPPWSPTGGSSMSELIHILAAGVERVYMHPLSHISGTHRAFVRQ